MTQKIQVDVPATRPAKQSEKTTLSEVELALRERIKELECLYAISGFNEQHFTSPDRFLQSVVDYLPRSWLYPEKADARIVYDQRQYVSERFHAGPWHMAAEVRANGKAAGVVEVFYRKGVPASADGPFLREEYVLLRAVAERVGSTLMHMKTNAELRDAYKALHRQHQAVQDSNTTLRTILLRLEDEKREIRASILANIQRIIMPIVFELELAVAGQQRSYVTMLRQSLQEIASPFLTELARDHLELTPGEIAITTMIRNGLSTKEIAKLRSISVATVRRHRENIRRKLGLRNQKVNLVTYLEASSGEQRVSVENRPQPVAEDVLAIPSSPRSSRQRGENGEDDVLAIPSPRRSSRQRGKNGR
jgi:DNA-binding NarL/FixJ family response regulator